MFGFIGKVVIVAGVAYGGYIIYHGDTPRGIAIGVLLFALGSFIAYMGGLFDGE